MAGNHTALHPVESLVPLVRFPKELEHSSLGYIFFELGAALTDPLLPRRWGGSFSGSAGGEGIKKTPLEHLYSRYRAFTADSPLGLCGGLVAVACINDAPAEGQVDVVAVARFHSRAGFVAANV